MKAHGSGLRLLLVLCVSLAASFAACSRAMAQGVFRRADANADATVDISDALFTLGYLFLGTDASPCLDAADSNDDGTIDISDATFTLSFLFNGTAAPPAPGPATAGPDPTDDALSCGSGPGGVVHGYVTSRMRFPHTQNEAQSLAFNLDGDLEGRADNQLGNVMALAAQSGVGFQEGVDAALASGRVILLHRLEADDLAGSSAGDWRVLVGEDVAPPVDLSGVGEFAVAPGAPPGAHVPGTIAAGRFTGGPGTVQVEIAAHPAVSIVLDLVGAHIDAGITEAGSSDARIGGGITLEEIDEALIPGLAATFQAFVDDDPQSEPSQTLLSLYDEDQDGRIDIEDLRASSIIASLLAPDVDLLDAGGAFLPLADGVKDSLSFAFGFECVRAQISMP